MTSGDTASESSVSITAEVAASRLRQIDVTVKQSVSPSSRRDFAVQRQRQTLGSASPDGLAAAGASSGSSA
jgi:hypothetical protein